METMEGTGKGTEMGGVRWCGNGGKRGRGQMR